MKRLASIAVLCWAALHPVIAAAAEPAPLKRDPAQVRAFRATHPCPATGKTTGACPGWVVDHDYPLCAGGRDHPSNMRWQKYPESLAKDRVEIDLCRVMAGAKRIGPLKVQP